MRKIMIAWVAYQRRADCMKEYWGYDLYHIHTSFGRTVLSKPIDYVIKILKTLYVLFVTKPDQLWVQLPPSLLLHLAFFYRCFFNRNCSLIADLHNSMLRDKWIRFPFTLSLLNKMDVVLAHNDAVAEELILIGVDSHKISVLEDFPFQYQKPLSSNTGLGVEPYIIFPCSFDVDEPIWTVIEAAKSLSIKFYVTGNSRNFVNVRGGEIPANIIFTGYISKAEYEALLLNSTIVLGMTTRQNVQLSVANEGLSASKPLVLSDTKVLTQLYKDAALFVDNEDPASLVNAINFALDNLGDLSQATASLLVQRTERWKYQASQVGLQ